MEQDKSNKPVKREENIQDKAEKWIEKAEDFIDETSEKIHNSESYRKADQAMEKATKSLFRKAGRWWGKSERYFKNQKDKEE